MSLILDNKKEIRYSKTPRALSPRCDAQFFTDETSLDDCVKFKGKFFDLELFEPTSMPNWDLVFRLDGLNEIYLKRLDDGRVLVGAWSYYEEFNFGGY